MRSIFFVLAILTGCTSLSKDDNSMTTYFAENQTPGYVLWKIKDGEIVFQQSGGLRAIDFETKITPQDRWHIGSCTKSMTAYLIGILIDEDHVRLNDKVIKFFPKATQLKHLTIQDLLTHRSGLPEVTELQDKTAWSESFRRDKPVSELRQNFVNAVLKEKPRFARDSKFAYSNNNYVLLGTIIEKIEKDSWENSLNKRIFQKLGMSEDCGFGPQATRDLTPPDQPWGHTLVEGKLTSVPPKTKEMIPSDNPLAIGPAGTVHCSFESWSKFLIEMLNASNGQSKLLKNVTAKKFFEPYKDQMTYAGWGGIINPERGTIRYTMVGSNTMNYALYVIDPKKKLIFMGATNSGTEKSLMALYGKLKELDK